MEWTSCRKHVYVLDGNPGLTARRCQAARGLLMPITRHTLLLWANPELHALHTLVTRHTNDGSENPTVGCMWRGGFVWMNHLSRWWSSLFPVTFLLRLRKWNGNEFCQSYVRGSSAQGRTLLGVEPENRLKSLRPRVASPWYRPGACVGGLLAVTFINAFSWFLIVTDPHGRAFRENAGVYNKVGWLNKSMIG